MQLLSPNLMIAAVTASPAEPPLKELFQLRVFQQLKYFFIVGIVAAEAMRILAYWLSSKAVAEPTKATLPSALKVWLSFWIFAVVSFFILFIVGGLVGFTALEIHHTGPLILTIFGLSALFFLFVTLFIPMNIYSIGIIRSFCFLIMALFITFIAMIPVNLVLLKVMGVEQAATELQTALAASQGHPDMFYKTLAGQMAPDEIDRMLDEGEGLNGRTLSLPEREAMVVTIQQKLSARKATLPPGNPLAQATFQKQLDRYLRFRASVVNEMNSQPGAASRPH